MVFAFEASAYTIEFNANASLVFPAGQAVLLVPVFTVGSQAPCESVARFDQQRIEIRGF